MNSLFSLLWSFKWPFIVLVFGVAVVGYLGGAEQAVIVAVLAVLEISLSFDNAVLNATILKRMNAFWQMIFMTVGIVIAVVGMRLLFPVVIVAATASLSFGTVVDLILNNPTLYAEKLEMAHPAIAAFGGMFLFMIFLDFVLDEAKRIHWINAIEEPLAVGGRIKTLSTLIALLCLLIVAGTWGHEHAHTVLQSGVVGLVVYLGVRGLSQLFEQISGVGPSTASNNQKPLAKIAPLAGRAAFFLFLYLEVLDASFSFDGVVGAFAITSNVLTIAIGLGVGAFFVRELTVWLVRHDTLSEFVYLEHGAHYAIGVLAVLLAVSLSHEVPELVTGLTGLGFIALSLWSSLRHRKRLNHA